MATVSVSMWHHRFDWADNGTVEGDLIVVALEQGWPKQADLGGDVFWARAMHVPDWFGPGPMQEVFAMLGAELLMPGLGRMFSGQHFTMIHSRTRTVMPDPHIG